MIATQSPELDRILTGIPGVKQVDAVEDASFIRFTIELDIDPADHHQNPQIYIIFTQSEFAQLRTNSLLLDAALRNRVEQASWKDGSNGSEVRTSLRLDRGVWFALTVDGSMWEFDSQKGRWIKGSIEL